MLRVKSRALTKGQRSVRGAYTRMGSSWSQREGGTSAWNPLRVSLRIQPSPVGRLRFETLVRLSRGFQIATARRKRRLYPQANWGWDLHEGGPTWRWDSRWAYMRVRPTAGLAPRVGPSPHPGPPCGHILMPRLAALPPTLRKNRQIPSDYVFFKFFSQPLLLW